MGSKKDFRAWHAKKSIIDGLSRRPYFHEREIWFCHLGENVGFEQDGRGKDFLRPVLVLRKFNQETFWAVPLTKARIDKKRNSPHFFCFSFIPGVESAAILSQIRLLDARRLAWKIGLSSKGTIQEITKRLKELFP